MSGIHDSLPLFTIAELTARRIRFRSRPDSAGQPPMLHSDHKASRRAAQERPALGEEEQDQEHPRESSRFARRLRQQETPGVGDPPLNSLAGDDAKGGEVPEVALVNGEFGSDQSAEHKGIKREGLRRHPPHQSEDEHVQKKYNQETRTHDPQGVNVALKIGRDLIAPGQPDPVANGAIQAGRRSK